MKGRLALDDEERQTRPDKNKMGSFIKRFMKKRAATSGKSSKPSRSLWRKNYLKRDRSERPFLDMSLPEILKVSPMGNSCEVTLVSSSDEDGPGTRDQITVTTQDGTSTFDDYSYHVVLNPHRSGASRTFFEDDEEEIVFGVSSVGSTHDLTTEFTPSAQSSSATCTDTATNNNNNNNNNSNIEETIYFDQNDEEYMREHHDIMIRKESLFYKSLFDDSDESDDEDDEFWENHENWRNGSSPRITDDPWYYDERVSAHEQLQKQKEVLNTSLDTTLLENEYDDIFDELTLDSREEGFPIEITVQI